jgi:hypothetical protein
MKIQPVSITTKGGYKATIREIDETDTDCFVGTLQGGMYDLISARWNLSGICRGQTDNCNIDMNQPELEELLRLKKMNAQS